VGRRQWFVASTIKELTKTSGSTTFDLYCTL